MRWRFMTEYILFRFREPHGAIGRLGNISIGRRSSATMQGGRMPAAML